MNDTTQTLLRSILKIGAGYFVAKGFGDQSTWEVVAAGAAALIGVIWGYLHRTPQGGKGAEEKRSLAPGLPPHPLILLFTFSPLLLFGLTTGCAYNRPHLVETVTGTNGIITTREMTMRSFVLWPATSALDKQKASIGKIMSAGTEGLGQEGGGTNVVEALRAIQGIISTLAK